MKRSKSIYKEEKRKEEREKKKKREKKKERRKKKKKILIKIPRNAIRIRRNALLHITKEKNSIYRF